MQSCSNYESDTASFSWYDPVQSISSFIWNILRDPTITNHLICLSGPIIHSPPHQLETYVGLLYLKSRFSFGAWIYCIIEFEGNQSLVITFLTIAKNCKNSAAPGQVYCSVAAGAGVEILKVEITKWFRIKSCGLFVYLLGHKFGKFNVRRGVKTND